MDNTLTQTSANTNIRKLVKLIERLIHLFVWFIYLIPIMMTGVVAGESFGTIELVDTAIILESLLFDLLIFYIVYLLLIPRFWVKDRKLLFFLSILSLLLLYPVAKAFADDFVYEGRGFAEGFYAGLYAGFNDVSESEMAHYEVPYLAGFLLSALKALFLIGFSSLLWYSINWFKKDKIKSQLESQNLSGELSWLRSQINPHFLFNTLNNIYYLIYSGSSEAPNVVLKLSALLRYMLYESDAPKVPLEKEVEYLKDFISLQQMRIKQKDVVDFQVEGDIPTKMIAPMLLIPFVENAFKHGSLNEGSPCITIHLKAKDKQIQFSVKNFYKEISKEGKDKVGGIGLSNIQRRLELIYPDEHHLLINKMNNQYHVNLLIEEL